MKILISCIGFLLTGTLNLSAQTKYISKTGHVSFFSSAPLENIEAHNYQALSIVDSSTGEVAVSVLMKAFEFDKALMQEHFNENYVESDKYPKATFKGRIANFGHVRFSPPADYFFDVEGMLTIHGISKRIIVKVKLSAGEQLNVSGKFEVKVADFGIKIPTVVAQNIAETVEVRLDLIHKKFE